MTKFKVAAFWIIRIIEAGHITDILYEISKMIIITFIRMHKAINKETFGN